MSRPTHWIRFQTTLSDIKKQLIAATTPGVDRVKIQAAITQDQAQLASVSNSANFNGQNFLAVDLGTAGYNSSKNFVASFSRDLSGAISVGSINLDTSTTALFDSNGPVYATGAYSGGIGTSLSQTSTALPTGVTAAAGFAYSFSTANNQLSVTTYTQDSSNTTGNPTYFSNTVSLGAYSGTAPITTDITVTAGAAGTLTAGDTMGGVATLGAAAPAYDSTTHTLTFSIADNSTVGGATPVQYDQIVIANFTPTGGNGILDTEDKKTTGSYTDAKGVTTTTTGGTGVSIFNMNISGLTDSAPDMATLNSFQKQVDAAIASVASAASGIGTAQSRITQQSSFVVSLQTSINDGVGNLVDADLNTASTRLQALQVQQQLGVQSLSIANQSTQMVLKLFQ